jgi:hypothetical protein
VDWDTALRENNGRVNALGLFDLDRKIRPVGSAYKQLIADWRDVLPTQSVCLTIPINYDVIGEPDSAAPKKRKNRRSPQALFNAGKANPNDPLR